jgi:hypothetical protein
MLRPSRRLSVALLWLAIVMLPLRAGAVLLMPTLMGGGAAAEAQATPAAVAAAMPCHVVAVDTAGGPADKAPQTCSYCDLCQANMLQPAWHAAVLPDLPHAAPPTARAQFIASNVPDGLFRPPRPFLA